MKIILKKHKTQKHSLKENLFFRSTRPIVHKVESYSVFCLLMMLPLLTMPLFFGAAALKVNIPQQNQPGIIYVGENAFIYGIEESTNARIVKIEAPLEHKGSKKVVKVKIKNRSAISKKNDKTEIKDLPKLSKPKFIFKSTKLNESFDSGTLSNTRNSVITPVFVSQNMVQALYTEFHIPVFVYLMNIYTADFSKTAALSQFLFSRPPPPYFI